ncbi:septin-12 [Spea bombifrons]|uniref:septin-12 n=1 Tax=Spea bombifrons TaxID=233779 RepID=UPI00234B30DC|nr:septin-12 [Spea bombifrons]
MSGLSVNDHLEGILSDFEALKRSFDMEDVDDTPVFSPTSPLNSPFSPAPANAIRASNGERRVSAGSHQPLYQSRISISSSCSPAQSPVLKTRITSSLSFNRGTMQMAKTNGNSNQGLTRVSSFQTRLNPTGFSSSATGSDSESLHSSTSSLECPPATKPFHQIRPTQTSVGQQGSSITVSNISSPILKKFSSHGSVFHSEVERPGVHLVPVTADNHSSLPSLDLHIAEDHVPDLVPSPDAGYPPSEGWSSPTEGYKQSRSSKSVSREPSFSSSSSSSSPPADAPINCTSSPPPLFGPLQQTTLQKFPVSFQGPVVKSSNGPVSEQINKPLPRTQLRVNLNAIPGQGPRVNREKNEVPFKDQLQGTSLSRTPSGTNSNPHRSPFIGSRMRSQSLQQESLPDSNLDQPAKQREMSSSTERLRSMMQRANSFNKTDSASFQRSCFQEAPAGPKPLAYTGVSTKSVSEAASQAKSSVSSRIQGYNTPPSVPCTQDSQFNRRVKEESRNGIRSLNQGLQNDRRSEVSVETPGVHPSQDPPATSRCTEDAGQASTQVTESRLEDRIHKAPADSSKMEEPTPVPPEEVMDPQVAEDPGREPFGYVGIDSVLDQMRRKAMKSGFEFNIMVVGQSGLGKSTLVNTLFKSKVIRKSPGSGIPKTMELKEVSQVIEERGVEMRLTVIDTPGFGDQINNQNCWEPIIKYIHEQYEKYLREEILVNRKRRIPDSRIHSCIYFIPPTGHWLRPLDLEFMKRLGRIVNVVPVIAKADTLTLEEREEFKQRIRKDLKAHGISVYPQPELDEDPADKMLNDKIREKIPFAVVGTDEEHQVNGKKILGRKTKWGIIEVENTTHCEFADLRDLLIRSNLQDLKDITHNIHYETYRVSRLNEKIQGSPTYVKDPAIL